MATPAWYRILDSIHRWARRGNIFYEGEDVLFDLSGNQTYQTHWPMRMDFDTGTDGEVPSVYDRGSDSSIGEIFGSPTYSSDNAFRPGSLALKASGTNNYISAWFDSEYKYYGRAYFYFTGRPASTQAFFSTMRWSLQMLTDGRISWIGTSTSTVPLNQWVRFEWHINTTSATATFRYYEDANSTTPTEEVSGGWGDQYDGVYYIGTKGSTWSSPFYTDNVANREETEGGWWGRWQQVETPATAITYTVRDYFGNIVLSGEFEEKRRWFKLNTPTEGWKPGWYRVDLDGPQYDSTYGYSYGQFQFGVIRVDDHFPVIPGYEVQGSCNDEVADYPLKGALGMGTSRLLIRHNGTNPWGLGTKYGAIFQKGVHGNTITSATAEGTPTVWSSVGGTPKYDNTWSAYGNMSAKFTSSGDYLNWDIASSNHYGRFYFHATQYPSVDAVLFEAAQSGNVVARVGITTTGKIFIKDDNDVNGVTGSVSIPLDTRVRISYQVLHSNTVGQIVVRWFSDELATWNLYDEQISSPASWATGTAATDLTYGYLSGTWTSPFWMDCIIGNDTDHQAAYPNPTDTTSINSSVRDAEIAKAWWVTAGSADTVRAARELWCAFPETTTDLCGPVCEDPFGWEGWIQFSCKDLTVNGSTTFVAVQAGSASGIFTVTVRSPDSSTVVETYTNKTPSQLVTDVNANSDYLHIWEDGSAYGRNPVGLPYGPVAIGNTRSQAVIDTAAVLYPLGVTHFEGPANELDPNSYFADGPNLTHMTKLFHDAVKLGNSNAKVMAPCLVSINTGWVNELMDAGLGSYIDDYSSHSYVSFTGGFASCGDMNMGKTQTQAWVNELSTHSFTGNIWQTEATHSITHVFGTNHHRRAPIQLMELLVSERYGVPRERNNPWYDVAHGFGAYPTWWVDYGKGIEPQAIMHRVLAEETWAKAYLSSLDFGTLGNGIYIGDIYEGSNGDQVLVLMAASYMDGASVTLSITGVSAVTAVDGFGNAKNKILSNGRVTIRMTEIPAYVRLPEGTTVDVWRINGWSPAGITTSYSPSATTKTIDGTTYSEIADDGWMTSYSPLIGMTSAQGVPGNVTLQWSGNKRVKRVLVWCFCAYDYGTLLDFDVQTFTGEDWVTRKTITKPTPDWRQYPAGDDIILMNWDEQRIFDIELPETIDCQGVRLNIRDASYGGEPLRCYDESDTWLYGGGSLEKSYAIQEVAVVDENRVLV